jgi:hypothetical protein
MIDEINEYARGIAEDLRTWPTEAVEDLAQLLINFDGLPTPGRKRENQIGLLIELLWRRSEATVTSREYAEERRIRELNGAHWPSVRQLCDAYGEWLTAVEVSRRVLNDNRYGAAAHARHYGSRHKKYARGDVLREIRRARDYFGVWPRYHQYKRLRDLEYERMRATGAGLRDVPSLNVIEKHCGSWDRAVELAKLDSDRNGGDSNDKNFGQKQPLMKGDNNAKDR